MKCSETYCKDQRLKPAFKVNSINSKQFKLPGFFLALSRGMENFGSFSLASAARSGSGLSRSMSRDVSLLGSPDDLNLVFESKL